MSKRLSCSILVGLSQSQLLLKRLRIWLSAKKLGQDVQSFATATLLQHGPTIPSALLRIHGILAKDAVEHVGAVNLAEEIAIVSSIIPRDDVAECGVAVAWD